MALKHKNNKIFQQKSSNAQLFHLRKCGRTSFWKTNPARGLHKTLSRYLWFHGIGFERGLNCSGKYRALTAVSLILVLLFEGRSIFKILDHLISLKNNTINKRYRAVTVIVLLIKFLNRIFIYTRREKLKDMMQRLGKIYNYVGESGVSVRKFTFMLNIILLINDLIMYSFVIHDYYCTAPKIPGTYSLFEFIPSPFAVPCRYISVALDVIGLCQAAVTAYFCSACFLIKESLTALNKRLQHNKHEDLEPFFDVYCKISDAVSSINEILHPSLLSSVSTSLLISFRNVYYALFHRISDNVSLDISLLLQALVFLSQCACVCFFGSSVINAAADIRATAQKSPVKFSQLRSLHIVSTLKEGVEGFKICNSIAIEKSFILSVLGAFVTYGMLFATFSTNRNGAVA